MVEMRSILVDGPVVHDQGTLPDLFDAKSDAVASVVWDVKRREAQAAI